MHLTLLCLALPINTRLPVESTASPGLLLCHQAEEWSSQQLGKRCYCNDVPVMKV